MKLEEGPGNCFDEGDGETWLLNTMSGPGWNPFAIKEVIEIVGKAAIGVFG